MEAVYRDTQREYALSQITAVLEGAKILHVPLKGAVTCHYYPYTWMRTSCDVDILIDMKNMAQATEQLKSAGFSSVNHESIHDYSLNSPNDVRVELHFTLQQGDMADTDCALRFAESLGLCFSYTPWFILLSIDTRVLFGVSSCSYGKAYAPWRLWDPSVHRFVVDREK